ncbi:MAG: sulfur carrier protein ThiS [Gammaproteobacteria bacterium]|nr:sulfur carrier protein ThiS [Gammaproteobacteria bacterium]
MHIILNGERTEVADNMTAQALIEQLDLVDRRLALEINKEIVLRGEYAAYILQTDDQVEIVHAIGGG